MLGGQPQDCRGLGVVLSGQLGQAHLPTGGVLDHDFSLIVRRMPEALATANSRHGYVPRGPHRSGHLHGRSPGFVLRGC